MSVTDFAIKNRVASVVFAVILALAGLLAYVTIPKEAQPQIEFATIVVTTVYPGASPDDIEAIITQKVEQEVAPISGIDEVRSTSTEGVSTVIVEFTPDKDITEAAREVREAVDLAKVEFPADVEEPFVTEIDMAELPIVTVNLLTSGSLAQLRDVAEDLEDEMEGVPGVLGVDLVGGLEREVQVNVDLTRLQGTGLAIGDVVAAIQTENVNIPGGSIDVGRDNYLLRVDGEFDDPREIGDLVVAAPGGQPIYVRDVAEVVFDFKDRQSYARLQVRQTEDEAGDWHPVADPQNLQVISLLVKKRAGDNIIETTDGVRAVLEGYAFPAGTTYTVTGDQSVFVEALVKDLENNIVAGLLFVIAVLLFFLGVRNATLVGLAIPLSMFLSFIIFQVMGQSLNFIMLFSLIIALGMLVDNAIVIVENIVRYLEEGHSRWDAARLATNEVGLAVAASTATTVAAFAPMLLWPGIIGKFMSYMPLTLIVTLSASLFVALVINPVLTGYFVRLEGERGPDRGPLARKVALGLVALTALIVGLANWKSLVFLVVAVPVLYVLHTRAMKPVGDRFARVTMPKVVEGYRRFLSWMLERDYSGRRALLKNTFALGAFTAGFFLLVIGGVFSAAVGMAPALVFLVPGGLLLVVGLLAIGFHALESAYLGGMRTVKAAGVFLGLFVAILGLLLLAGKEVPAGEVVGMLLFPAVPLVAGLLGARFARGREHLVLTDNRARLLTGTLATLFAIFALFAVAPTGVEFFPTTDPSQIWVTAEAPLGTNVEASNRLAEDAFARIERQLGANAADAANTKNVLTNVGVGGDAQFGGGAASAERSRITLDLVDYADRPESSALTLQRIREAVAGIPNAEVTVEQDQGGPPTGAPVNIEVSGDDFGQIVRIARDLRLRLQQGVAAGAIHGLVDVRDNLSEGRPELRVNIDRERAAAFGLSTFDVANVVRGAVNGVEASTYRDGRDEYDITVRLREEDREQIGQVEALTILHEGRQIPITAVADVEVGSGLGAVTRLDQRRVVTVLGDAAPGANANAMLAEAQAHLAEYVAALPPGYTVTYTGASQEQDESFAFLTNVLLIALALISLILIAQFNSVVNPFIIMVATGLSLIGVLLGLILTRTPFGLMTFVGVISLAGIVVNNAIVLVDYAEQLRARGIAKREAIVQAGATRLRPVLLTALTTVIGLIPLTFGINVDFVGLFTDLDPAFSIGSENTQFWGPMGTSIISGLSFATFLTLVIVPVMYSVFDSVALRLGRRFGVHTHAEEEALLSGDLAPATAHGEGDGAAVTMA